MNWNEFWRDVAGAVVRGAEAQKAATIGVGEAAGRVGAAAGTSAGGGSPRDILASLGKAAPVAPGEAIKETAASAVGVGPLARDLRTFWVWVIIALVGLIGVWGLVAPGGGVASIERMRK